MMWRVFGLKKKVKVEVQIRTIAMDFWASLEHQLKYKQEFDNQEEIISQLKECSETIAWTDKKMLGIRKQIEAGTDVPTEEVLRVVEEYCRSCRLCFFPGDLIYLKAGGRVSNAEYLGAKVLSLMPRIEAKEGKLTATRKYRGNMKKNAVKLLRDFTKEKKLKKQVAAFGYSYGLDAEIRKEVTQQAELIGFEQILWFQTGCVVSTHGVPVGLEADLLKTYKEVPH